MAGETHSLLRSNFKWFVLATFDRIFVKFCMWPQMDVYRKLWHNVIPMSTTVGKNLSFDKKS